MRVPSIHINVMPHVLATGACYHALGYHRSAARDYGQAFSMNQPDSSNEVKMQQFLAFYQVCSALRHFQACSSAGA